MKIAENDIKGWGVGQGSSLGTNGPTHVLLNVTDRGFPTMDGDVKMMLQTFIFLSSVIE